MTAVGKTTVSTTLGRAFTKMKADECAGGFEKVKHTVIPSGLCNQFALISRREANSYERRL